MVRKAANIVYAEATALYLSFYISIRLTISSFSGVGDNCFAGSDCIAVLQSSLASVAGIPLSAFGVLLSMALVIALLIDVDCRISIFSLYRKLLLTAGVVCIGLQVVSIFWIGSLCYLCLAYAVSIVGACGLSHWRYYSKSGAGTGVGKVGLICSILFCLHSALFPMKVERRMVRNLIAFRAVDSSIDDYTKVRFGGVSGERLIAIVNIECPQCSVKIPKLIGDARKSRVALELWWSPRSVIGTEVSLLVIMAANLGDAEDVVARAFRTTYSDLKDVENLAGDLGMRADLDVARLGLGRWVDAVNKNVRACRALEVVGTPAFISLQTSGRVVELSFEEARRFLQDRKDSS